MKGELEEMIIKRPASAVLLSNDPANTTVWLSKKSEEQMPKQMEGWTKDPQQNISVMNHCRRKTHTGSSLGVTSGCPVQTPPARLDPACRDAQHTWERIRMHQGETACPSFKMKSLPYAFTKQNKQNTQHMI